MLVVQFVRFKASKAFFFEKKKQKTFATFFRASERPGPNEQKFFGSFFQKRTRLNPYPPEHGIELRPPPRLGQHPLGIPQSAP